MNTLAIFLLLGLASFSSAQTTNVAGFFGIGVSVKGGVHTTINYLAGLGPSLELLVSADTSVTLGLYGTLTGSLPRGYANVAVAAAAGFTISLTNGSVIVAANLTSGGLDFAAQQAINASAGAAVLQVNAAANGFQQIAISSYSVAKGITIPIPEAGTYVLVAVNANVPVPQFYARIKKLVAQARAAIVFSTNFVVDVTASANADLNVTFVATNPAPKNPPAKWVPLNVYWDISVSGGASVNAVLNYTFTAAQLTAANVNASALRFAFYNTATAAWEFVAGASVDVNARVVSQTTTHFSQWGVYADGPAQSGSETATATAIAGSSAQGVFVSFFLLLASLFAFL